MRARLAFVISALVVVLILIVGYLLHTKRATEPSISSIASHGAVISSTPTPDSTPTAGASASSDYAPTNVYAHNLMLRKGPNGFRVYVRWLRGQMVRASRDVNPSFDEPVSFVLEVQT